MNKSIDCDSVLESLSDIIDQDVRQELCQAILDHLSTCRDCTVKVDKARMTITLYQSNGRTSAELPMRASAKLAAALKAEYGANGRAD